MALAALHRHDELLQEMRVALDADPLNAMAWLLKAQSLIGKADLTQAQAALAHARSLDPHDPKLVEVQAAFDHAHATGFEGGAAECTGTREYPQAQLQQWRAQPPQRFDDKDESSITADEASPPTKESILSSEMLRSAFAVEEQTMLDPAPDTDRRARVSGVDESTQLGGPLDSAPIPRGLLDRDDRDHEPHEAPRRRDLETRERPALPKRALPTRLPPDAPTRVLDDVPPVDEAPSNEDFRFDSEESFRSIEPTGRRDQPSQRPLSTPRVRPLRDEPPSVSLHEEPIVPSDPSISLSSNEIVFVPSPSAEEPEPAYVAPHVPAPDPPDEPAPRVQRRPRRGTAPPPQAPPPELSFRPAQDRISDVETQPPANKVPSQQPASLLSRAVEALPFSSTGGRSPVVSLVALFAGAVAIAIIAGLAIREWRLRIGVARRYELAQRKLTTGNYAGFQAAEMLYRQILTERDDPRAATLRAKVLAQLAFEFGEPPEPAARAMKALPQTQMTEAQEADVYLALAHGELDVAARGAVTLLKAHPTSQAHYLLGEAHLLQDQPDDAIAALKIAAAEEPQNPLVLHALGLAEAAAHQPGRAFEAYTRALAANSNHVATIIDRALLQLHENIDRDAAAGSLDGVVNKLVGDASPGQLARAYVGLAELELGKGNVAQARADLGSAAARRRDHPLLLEELAKAYADAFELDPAEREARRALQVSGRLTPRLILAEVALRRSRPVQALTVLEEAGSTRPEALVLRALAKLELGRTSEARTDAELATHLDALSVSAAVALARVDIAEGKYDVAQQRLEAIEAQAKHAEVALALGQVFLARHMPDKARTCFRSALLRQPLLLEARLQLARLLHDSGQLSEARDEVNRVLAINAAYVPARRELASIALDLGDAVAARDELDALSDRDADLDTLLGAARAHLLLGDARGAEERADRALRMKPSGADLEAAQCMKARALLLDHRPNEAIQTVLLPVRTAQHGEIVALLIEAYLDYGRLDWAEKAVEIAPVGARTGIELTLAKARIALAEAREQAAKGLVDEAIVRLKIGRSPTWLRAQALGLECQTELELGQAKSAVKSCKSALELDPRAARTNDELGLALLDLKRFDEAAPAFEAAVASDPRLAEAQYYLGRTRRALGNLRYEDPLKAYLALESRGALADDARRILAGGEVTLTNDRPRSRRSGPPR